MEPQMATSVPNVPLWPRGSRTGTRPAAISSVSAWIPAGAWKVRQGGRWPGKSRPAIRRSRPASAALLGGLALEGAKALHAREDRALAIVEAGVDVDREDIRPAQGADPERDGHGVLALVADGDRNAAHAQLLH